MEKKLFLLLVILGSALANAQEGPTYALPPTIEYRQAQPIAVEGNPLAPEMTPAERERMLELHYAIRDMVASRVDNSPFSLPGAPLIPGSPSTVSLPNEEGATQYLPSDLILGRNNPNPRAANQSALAEPAAANEGIDVLFTGNTHAEFSRDGGVTYTNIPLGAGPPGAPNPCCDLVGVVHQCGPNLRERTAAGAKQAARWRRLLL